MAPESFRCEESFFHLPKVKGWFWVWVRLQIIKRAEWAHCCPKLNVQSLFWILSLISAFFYYYLFFHPVHFRPSFHVFGKTRILFRINTGQKSRFRPRSRPRSQMFFCPKDNLQGSALFAPPTINFVTHMAQSPAIFESAWYVFLRSAGCLHDSI